VPLDVRLKIDDLRDEGGDQARDAAAREKIISYLVDLAEKEYTQLTARIVDMTRQNMGDTHTTHAMLEIEKLILVRSIDTLWVEHIDAMDHLRRGIGLRGYGQRDPLVEYKKEAYRMFVELQNNIQKQVTYSIYKVGLAPPVGLDKKDEISGMRFSGAKKTMEKGMSGLSASSSTLPQGTSAASTTLKAPSGAKQAPVAGKPKTAEGKKVGRNDPCPCGAINPETKKSYKFKKCGMINAPHHKG
jgi:preprotein translocase subunit SecA